MRSRRYLCKLIGGLSITTFAGCQGTKEPDLTNDTNQNSTDTGTETPSTSGLGELSVVHVEDKSSKKAESAIPSNDPLLKDDVILQDAFDGAVESGRERYTTRNEAIIERLFEKIGQIPMHDGGRYVDHEGNLLRVSFGVND